MNYWPTSIYLLQFFLLSCFNIFTAYSGRCMALYWNFIYFYYERLNKLYPTCCSFKNFPVFCFSVIRFIKKTWFIYAKNLICKVTFLVYKSSFTVALKYNNNGGDTKIVWDIIEEALADQREGRKVRYYMNRLAANGWLIHTYSIESRRGSGVHKYFLSTCNWPQQTACRANCRQKC